ncbi:MAG TPA: aromatic amino acid lyase, partial [Cyclobacteriaceae bacterium]|nr:aromatic amino acid lyase [Cyclobacteriaceae bacterium]
MNKVHPISAKTLSLDDIAEVLKGQIKLSGEAISKITACRDYLDRKVSGSTAPVYGINTGFGSLYSKNIASGELGKLQQNLVMSHACGTGPEVPGEIVRLMLLLKVQSLAYGYSGVQL